MEAFKMLPIFSEVYNFHQWNKQIIMNESGSNECHLKELFDEFKFHLIYKNRPKTTQSSGCEDLKNILSEIKRDCRAKRQKKKIMLENLNHFEALEQSKNHESTLQSRIWKPKKVDLESLEIVKEEVLIIEKQKQSLLEEISELETSLSSMKKNVAQVKKKVEIQSAKEEKYKHVSYLSKSIQRQTDTNKIINYRSYKKLVKYQEDAITNLKKFKTTLRKENEEHENRYIQFKEKQEANKRSKNRIDYSAETSAKMERNNQIKIDKTFINKLEDLIKLFKEKEPNFQQIKAEQTTKIRLKKIQKDLLRQQRVKLHEMIDRFQQAHDVKIESLPNLILYIFKRLNQDNQEMENQCIKHYRIKEILLEDLDKLKQKEQTIQQEADSSEKARFSYESQKRQRIEKNSQIFIKFVVLLHNLLGKFKYLFTMALTLNIEKKNFQDLLIQITNVYKFDSIFYQRNSEDSCGIAVDENLTNCQEMEEILNQNEAGNYLNKNDLLSLIFSDLRYVLMFRRCWLEEEIKQGLQDDKLLEKICAIQQRCQEIYNSKLKIYIHLLLSSLKALTMNKYEKKMIASSNVRDSLFLSIPKPVKLVNYLENDEIYFSSNKQNHQQVQKFNSEASEDDIPNFQFKDNPRKIVNLLEELKNQEKKTFKPFLFEPSQVYLYGNKVILPKYIF